MTEFSAKMRESVQVGMPVLSSSVNRPAVEGPGDVEGGADIVGGTLDGWFAALEQEEEDEEW